MSAKKKTLLDYVVQDNGKHRSPGYFMIRFTKAPDLRAFALRRVRELDLSKEDYLLALVAKDRAEQEEDL